MATAPYDLSLWYLSTQVHIHIIQSVRHRISSCSLLLAKPMNRALGLCRSHGLRLTHPVNQGFPSIRILRVTHYVTAHLLLNDIQSSIKAVT